MLKFNIRREAERDIDRPEDGGYVSEGFGLR